MELELTKEIYYSHDINGEAQGLAYAMETVAANLNKKPYEDNSFSAEAKVLRVYIGEKSRLTNIDTLRFALTYAKNLLSGESGASIDTIVKWDLLFAVDSAKEITEGVEEHIL